MRTKDQDDTELEEIRALHKAMGILAERPLTPRETVLHDKWAPFDVVGILLSRIDALRAELAVAGDEFAAVAHYKTQVAALTRQREIAVEGINFVLEVATAWSLFEYPAPGSDICFLELKDYTMKILNQLRESGDKT